MRTESDAEEAGWDAGYYGPNTTNCHFGYFATKELTAAWERGNARGKRDRDAEVARIAKAT
jgi:hypothetical protein